MSIQFLLLTSDAETEVRRFGETNWCRKFIHNKNFICIWKKSRFGRSTHLFMLPYVVAQIRMVEFFYEKNVWASHVGIVGRKKTMRDWWRRNGGERRNDEIKTVVSGTLANRLLKKASRHSLVYAKAFDNNSTFRNITRNVGKKT